MCVKFRFTIFIFTVVKYKAFYFQLFIQDLG